MFPSAIRYHADIFYLTSNCNDLTEEQRLDVLQQFIDVLNGDHICDLCKFPDDS